MTTHTVHGLLAARAASHPARCFLRFREQDFSFDQIDRWSNDLAGRFQGFGVRHGDLVAVMLPNRPEFVACWFALGQLGAVATLINTAMRGPALVHAMNLSRATVAIVDTSLLPSLESIRAELSTLRTLIVTDPPAEADRVDDQVETQQFEMVAFPARSFGGSSATGPSRTVEGDEPDEPAMVMFTSGTTGPSKGCVLSHRYAIRQAELMIEHLQLGQDDVLYCPFPLFHLDALVLTVMPALLLGATAAIGERFSASGFWNEIRDFGATVFDFMGATLTMLHKAPITTHDGENPVRLAWGVPVPEFADEFERRFSLRLVELYGSTDAGVPIYQPLDERRRPGSCGRVIPPYDVRLFDEQDRPVERGEVGEMVIRPNEPSIMSQGYFAMPEATLAANRNLWFHTGDLARQDDDGYFYYVGRRAESIRRRGENISSFEIEEVVKLHPHVLDAAAYGVPSALTEDDVMVAVVARPGTSLDPAQLVEFCGQRMARHMVPRYVDVVDELPRTPTAKVEKHTLIARGIGPRTWDRDGHGASDHGASGHGASGHEPTNHGSSETM